MAGAKEIRTKIKSIQNTQKITKAMEMVAASKMRRAQERMNQARPYATKMATVMAHLAQANLEYKHSYTETRDPKRVGFIVVSSDRGLCGGLNIHLFRPGTQWRCITSGFFASRPLFLLFLLFLGPFVFSLWRTHRPMPYRLVRWRWATHAFSFKMFLQYAFLIAGDDVLNIGENKISDF